MTEEGEAVDLAAVDTLQALFQISDKQADRLAQQVVTCVEINQCVGCISAMTPSLSETVEQ